MAGAQIFHRHSFAGFKSFSAEPVISADLSQLAVRVLFAGTAGIVYIHQFIFYTVDDKYRLLKAANLTKWL